MTPTRRDAIRIAGVAATTVAIGTTGWTPVAAQDDDALPWYNQWLTLEDGGLEFVAADWADVGEEVERDLDEAEPDEEVPPEYEADPMVAPVSEGLLEAYFLIGLDFAQYGLGRLLVEGAFETAVEGLLSTPATLVATGDVETDEIDAELTAEPEFDFQTQLEETGEIGGYTVYTPVEAGIDVALAVGGDALVYVDGAALEAGTAPTARLERAIGAAEGSLERASDESETVAWLLENAGGGDVVAGQYGDQNDDLVDFDYDGLEDAEGVVSSLTAIDAETATGEFAAVVDDPDEATLEATVGASGEDRSIDFDDDRVTATATWEEEDPTVT